jgi:hypothetical protein
MNFITEIRTRFLGIIPFLHIHVFYGMVNSVDPNQPAHPCHLIRICTVPVLIQSVISDQKTNSADPDKMA